MRQRCIGILAGGLLLAGAGLGASPAVAAPTSMVDLGQASTYAVLSGASVGNTVSADGAPHTTLRGDLGVKANTQPTGFPPGVVRGTINVGNAAAAQAHAALVAAYTEVAARTGGATLAGALAGATITPGLHTIAGAVSNTGTVTLDGQGDPNAVFVFQVNGAMAMAAGSHVVLTNGARASRVFWQVNGAGAIGANADFAGTLMALDAVAVGAGGLVNGRAFARNGALTLDADEFYSAPPVVTVDGGATDITTDTTPDITGATDVEAPGVVTVTINGQALTAVPSGGLWTVTSPILANATYPVVASVVDAAGNLGSATQQLTVDTVLPVVTIGGAPSTVTNDPTPTIDGTSDVAPGTIVRVSVGGAGPDRARADGPHLERDAERARRRHPRGHRVRHRSRRQRRHEHPVAHRRHHPARGDDHRRRHRADRRRDTGHLRDGGRPRRDDGDGDARRRDADDAGRRRRRLVGDRVRPVRRPASRRRVGVRRRRQPGPGEPDAHRRHGAADRRDHRRRAGDDERPRSDDHGNLEHRARLDHHRHDRGSDADDARAGERLLERDAGRRRRRDVAGRRLRRRPRGQHGERGPEPHHRARRCDAARRAAHGPARLTARRAAGCAAGRPARRSTR